MVLSTYLLKTLRLIAELEMPVEAKNMLLAFLELFQSFVDVIGKIIKLYYYAFSTENEERAAGHLIDVIQAYMLNKSYVEKDSIVPSFAPSAEDELGLNLQHHVMAISNINGKYTDPPAKLISRSTFKGDS